MVFITGICLSPPCFQTKATQLIQHASWKYWEFTAAVQPECDDEDLVGLPSCQVVVSARSSERANTVIAAIAQNRKLQLSDVTLRVCTSTSIPLGEGSRHVEAGDARGSGPRRGDLLGDQIIAYHGGVPWRAQPDAQGRPRRAGQRPKRRSASEALKPSTTTLARRSPTSATPGSSSRSSLLRRSSPRVATRSRRLRGLTHSPPPQRQRRRR